MESMTDEFRLAFETDRRFEFYITAAIFTILGVSVQTSEVYADRCAMFSRWVGISSW